MTAISQFQLTYELSPIILNRGIAKDVPGGLMPIISLTQAQDFSGGILQSNDQLNFEQFIAHFVPMSGGTLIENQVGMYPFANQYVAANAIISQPLKLSMMMLAPALGGGAGGAYFLKRAAFTSLQQQLAKHNALGGTYTIATPAMYYTEMLLLSLHDVTSEEGSQVQVRWQWDFIKPLLTQAQAAQAANGLITAIDTRIPQLSDPITYSGTATAVGQSASGVAPPLVPAAQQAGASSAGVGNQTTIGDSSA
jgi:hypothetical protein